MEPVKGSDSSFDFEKLKVYEKALAFYLEIRRIHFGREMEDQILAKQLNRAALSISLNIAEGSGRIGIRDRRNFYVISRASLFESIAILKATFHQSNISETQFRKAYNLGEEISKMLLRMIKILYEKLPDKKLS
jgi:four helix bundle protein